MDRTSRLSSQVSALCHSLVHDLFGGYRPELHYMRGPGPKCREKRETAQQAPVHEALSTSPDHAFGTLRRA